MRNATRGQWRFGLRPVAAAALLISCPLSALAQFYSYSGSVGSYPVDVFPIDVNASVLDISGNTLSVGGTVTGSFSALAGALLTLDSYALGDAGTGTGTMSVSGANARVRVVGSGGRGGIGNWGVGTLLVSSGGSLDASTNTGVCAGGWCGTIIGNGAGSTGTLTVTGQGSQFASVQSFNVGQTSVYTDAGSGFDFGTPGGTTNAFVNVLDGGTLRTERGLVGFNNGAPDGLGTEKAYGTVTISGAGSAWLMTPDMIGNSAAGLVIGTNAGGTGIVEVKAGGKLRIDGSGGPGPNDFVNIATNGGSGTLIVTGYGSSVDVVGFNTLLQVGRSGTGAVGSFSVLAAATASVLYMNVGRDGASGTMLIDGTGSTLTQAGVGSPQSYPPSTNGPAFASVGRNGGTGTVTVSGGGQWLISDGGGDGRVSHGNPGFALGRDANATGSLLITGAGSKVEISSTSLNPNAGVGDNYNPFVAIGYDNPSSTNGMLTIEAGGKLVMNGNALSTATNGRATTLNIGGRTGSAATGTATVTGQGSEILMTGFDTLINVGREDGSTGTLNVMDQAKVSTISLAIGVGSTTPGSGQARGTVNIDNATIALSGHRTDSSQVGAGTTIGRGANGVGALNLTHGASLTITPTMLASGMSLGGDQFLAGGTGTVSLDGGSSITFGGTVAGLRLNIGRSGNGTMTLAGASLVDIGALAETRLGAEPGGVGTLTVSGGSKFRTGIVNVGGYQDNVAGGTGVASFSGAGTTLDVYGATGLAIVGFAGNGSLSVADQAAVKGILLGAGGGATGSGTITLNNATVDLSGQANDPKAAVAGAGLYVGGLGGGVGSVTLSGGTKLTINNGGNLGAHLDLGGFTAPDSAGPGNGTLNVGGGSTIKVVAAPGLAAMSVGSEGTGTANLTGAGTQIDLGDGTLHVGRLPTGNGTVSIEGGAKLLTGIANIGGSSDSAAGGTGSLAVSGIDSELKASGATGFIGVGRGGTGTLQVDQQGHVSAIGLTIGRSGGNGTLAMDHASATLSGQQTAGNLSGARFNVGVGGGIGSATLNSSTISVSNAGSDGAGVNIGGSNNRPLGTGTLTMINSQITVSGAPGQGGVNIGRSGTGTATLSASTITNTDGNVFVGREAGSVGTLVMTSGSTLNAGYVGIGVSQPYDKATGTQHNGGTGTLVVNDSTINAGTFELGQGSTLSGNNGVLNVVGDVIVGGIISPGNSPGRLRINCNIITLPGSQMILDVEDVGNGLYAFDELLIGHDSTFNLHAASIVFNFIGNTNPESFAASGKFDMDTFLRSVNGNTETGLSSVFAAGQTWDDVVASNQISAKSSAYDVTTLTLQADGSFHVVAVPVPEPGTWGLMFFGLLVAGGYARWQRRAAAATQA